MKYFHFLLISFLGYQVAWSQRKFIGGFAETDIRNFPYMVAVMKDKLPFCGGAIISEYWGLTAAHCFPANTHAHQYLIISGTAIIPKVFMDSREYHNIYQFYRHESYDLNARSADAGFDIAVFKVLQPFQNSVVTLPVKLPAIGEPLYLAMATITGWGCTEISKMPSPVLLYATIPKMSDHECRSLYNTIIYPESIVCYGSPIHADYTQNLCSGDSGGPLVTNGVIIGIASMGRKNKKIPGVYTNVIFYREWIQSKTGI